MRISALTLDTRNWLPPVSLHFVSGYSKGDFIAHARIKEFSVSTGYLPGRSVRENLPFDWAVLTLTKEIANLVGTIPVGKVDERRPIAQAGYSKDKPHILTLNKICKIVRRDIKRGIIFHDCDATKGDSGSPILQKQGKLFEIIGIHVATRKRGKTVLGIGILNFPRTMTLNRAQSLQ